MNGLVLKEELPNFMDEANHSIAVMTSAGQGMIDIQLKLSAISYTVSQHALFPFFEAGKSHLVSTT